MYIAVVLLQTLILPLISGGIHLAVAGGNVLAVFGLWWAFWGVGTRLTVAGISQLTNPSRTTEGILGIDNPGAEQVVHELGYANLCMGLIGLISPFLDGWAILGVAPGALYMALAGLRHVTKRGKNTAETLATWTDLLVFTTVTLGVVAAQVR